MNYCVISKMDISLGKSAHEGGPRLVVVGTSATTSV